MDDGTVEYEDFFTAMFAVIFGAFGVGQVCTLVLMYRKFIIGSVRFAMCVVLECLYIFPRGLIFLFLVPFSTFKSGVVGVVACVLPTPTRWYLLQQITSDTKDAGEGEQAAAKIFRLTDEPLNIDPLSEEGAKPTEIMGTLGFKNIFFAYPSRPDMQVCW